MQNWKIYKITSESDTYTYIEIFFFVEYKHVFSVEQSTLLKNSSNFKP